VQPEPPGLQMHTQELTRTGYQGHPSLGGDNTDCTTSSTSYTHGEHFLPGDNYRRLGPTFVRQHQTPLGRPGTPDGRHSQPTGHQRLVTGILSGSPTREHSTNPYASTTTHSNIFNGDNHPREKFYNYPRGVTPTTMAHATTQHFAGHSYNNTDSSHTYRGETGTPRPGTPDGRDPNLQRQPGMDTTTSPGTHTAPTRTHTSTQGT